MEIDKLKEVIIKVRPIDFEEETKGKMIVIEKNDGTVEFFDNIDGLKLVEAYLDIDKFVQEEFGYSYRNFRHEYTHCDEGIRRKIREEFSEIDFIYLSRQSYKNLKGI